MVTRARTRAFVVLAALGALAVARAAMPTGALAEILFLLAPGAATIALARAARNHHSDDPTAWGTLAAAMVLLLTAEIVWAVLQTTSPNAFPTVADYLGNLGLAILVAGLWRTASRLSAVGDRTGYVDAAALALAAGVLAWLFLVEPSARATVLSSSDQIWQALPIALDIALLAMAVRLAFTPDVQPLSYRFVYVAVAAAMSIDLADSVLELGLGSEVGRLEDIIFMLSYGAWAGAAICRGPVRATPPSSIPHLGARRLSLLLVCAVTPLVALVGLEASGRKPDLFTLVGIGSASLVIWVLVGVRGAALISVGRALATAQGNERFAAMVENATDVVITIDAEEEITYASPSVLTLWGFDPADLIGRRFADITDPGDAGSVRRQLQNAVGIPSRSTVSFQTRVPRKHGGVCTCAAVAANLTDHAGVDGIVITLRDITAELALEHQLRAKAFNDELTGLANRSLFMDRVEHALRLRDDSSPREVAVLALDIDDFKHINEGLGHSAGDELLVAVGCRLTECVRPGDTVARLGADEFAILLQGGTGRTESLQFAARIDEVLALPLPAGALDLGVRVSIGIAIADVGSTAEDLVRDADIAMYTAKRSRGSSASVFDPTMRVAATDRISLQSDLDRAVEADQFFMLYQPIVDLRTGHIRSCEALVRWQHPERGLISPDEFIPIAEHTGQIIDIGRWVLRRSCVDAERWHRCGFPIGVAVNASTLQLRHAAFVDDVRSATLAAGLPPDALTVEITETAMMDDPDATEEVLHRLRALGSRIAIDDFGTGYSSLAYLQRFPVDTLKIDQSFVAEIEADSVNLLAHTIVRLANSLEIPAIAEGIEHLGQLENLARHGCAAGQGFYLARPMSAEALTNLVVSSDGTLPINVAKAATESTPTSVRRTSARASPAPRP